jgi:hypothetical protein
MTEIRGNTHSLSPVGDRQGLGTVTMQQATGSSSLQYQLAQMRMTVRNNPHDGFQIAAAPIFKLFLDDEPLCQTGKTSPKNWHTGTDFLRLL